MNRDHIAILYDYNYWANARVLDATAKVSREQFTAPARLSHGSLRGALVHALGTEIVWRSRCQEGLSLPALPAESELPTLEALRARWAEEERTMRGYLASLTDEDLRAKLHYKNTVEGEQVGLEGDLVDDADDLGDRLDSTASSAAWRAWSEFCFTVRRSRSVVRSFWTAASSFSHPARYFLSRAWRPRSVAASTKAARAPERSTSAGKRRFRRGRQASVWRTILPSIM